VKSKESIKKYILQDMRMSHIYQPEMLMTILDCGGKATVEEIAKRLLSRDTSQIDYYGERVKQMVGRVLVKNGIVKKDKDIFELIGFEELTESDIAEIRVDCENALNNFLQTRGDTAFSHRSKSSGYISGSIRYRILTRARFRCELCGISAEDKALEVDHIVPRNKDGSDDESNLQALCYSCNAMKRDTDSTDFRGWNEVYKHREGSCIFCNVDRELIAENELAYAFRDKFPVTDKHTLVVPKRHVPDYFDLYQPELNAINRLLAEIRGSLMLEDSTITGFNVGTNIGESSGQTVFHCHIHLIPRRDGDTDSPRGGVRGVIKNKQSYDE
jgi:diadenosine tetraphosphate (Ap4A) HIT family hydrolase